MLFLFDVYILPSISLPYSLFFYYLQQNLSTIIPFFENKIFLPFCTDDLPLRGFIGHLEESGFLPHSHKVFLWAHLNFNIEFNGDQVFEKSAKFVMELLSE